MLYLDRLVRRTTKWMRFYCMRFTSERWTFWLLKMRNYTNAQRDILQELAREYFLSLTQYNSSERPLSQLRHPFGYVSEVTANSISLQDDIF